MADKDKNPEQQSDPSVAAPATTESERRMQADVPKDQEHTVERTNIGVAGMPAEVTAAAEKAASEARNKVLQEYLDANQPDADTVFEVMVDEWGHDPKYVRGTYLKLGDAPYDMIDAWRMGALRIAPKQKSALAHATMPVELGSGGTRIDTNRQRAERES